VMPSVGSAVIRSVLPERLGFSGHQTFPFRYGWLKKAVDFVREDPHGFRREDALVILGVGKNMVESIRHWALATQVVYEHPQSHALHISEWGTLLFVEGLDPYLEDPASLWLIHWLLVTNPARAGVWYLAFNHFPYQDFHRQHLFRFVRTVIDHRPVRISENTLKRDIDCFIRTYVPSVANERSPLEDSFNCPLAELQLLRPSPELDSYSFVGGPKATLPLEVVAVVTEHFLRSFDETASAVTLQDCLYRPGSPGQVFRLDEASLVEYFEGLEALTAGALIVDDTAGLLQLYRRQPLDWRGLLQEYYRR